MKWIFTQDKPIYLQIVNQMEMALLSGEYTLGQKLPSVRDLAATAGVNPNTMQKALQELEQMGFIITHRTTGRTITEDKDMINNLRNQAAQKQVQDFLQSMEQLGFNKKDIVELINNQEEK